MSEPDPGRSDRPRVVVLGAGFAGLWTARALDGEAVDVLLLDRENYHTFFPLLYQVAAAELGPTEIAYPVRSILRKSPNVRFRMETVTRVDLERRTVVTDLEEIRYDYLVIALGSEPNFLGIEGAEEHAFPLRWIDQAMPLRHHILSRFESVVFERDPEARRRLLTFAIVGGGPTGVEFAGALAELIYGPLRRDYPMLDPDEVRVVLVEAMDRVLLGMPGELADWARSRLERRGVEVRTNTRVERVEPAALVLEGGERIDTETVVWTAGVKGDPEAASWGLPTARGGRVIVGPALQLPDHPEVFVAGDLAYAEDDEGNPLPQVAPVAMQMGERAAANIIRMTKGRGPERFRYSDPGMLAVIGRNAAVADIKGRHFKGFVAWILWLVIHIAKLIGFRNRALVLVNWAWNYVTYQRAVRLILPYGGGEGFEKEVERLEPAPATMPSELEGEEGARPERGSVREPSGVRSGS